MEIQLAMDIYLWDMELPIVNNNIIKSYMNIYSYMKPNAFNIFYDRTNVNINQTNNNNKRTKSPTIKI